MESYLFNALLVLRELSPPVALRVVEAAVLLLPARVAGALPWTAGLHQALLGAFDRWQSLAGTLLLAGAWALGGHVARLVAPLHPGRAIPLAGEGWFDGAATAAYQGVRNLALGLLGLFALALEIRAWLTGSAGWAATYIALPLLALLALLAVLMAALLHQRNTWRQLGLTPPAVGPRGLTAGRRPSGRAGPARAYCTTET